MSESPLDDAWIPKHVGLVTILIFSIVEGCLWSMVFLKLKFPFELFVKRSEFLPCSGFLSLCDVTHAVENDVKPHFFPTGSVSRRPS